MKLDWMMLANHAEVAPHSGDVVYITGGAWDTLTVRAPTGNDEVAGVFIGSVAIRLLLDQSEAEGQREFALSILAVDESAVAQVAGEFAVADVPDLPPDWPVGATLILRIAGMPIPAFGVYTMRLEVEGEIMGETRFRVVKGY